MIKLLSQRRQVSVVTFIDFKEREFHNVPTTKDNHRESEDVNERVVLLKKRRKH